ncbi:MAG TPA: GAF domain-containing sensor histidine kinase [Thermoanaerobaculia bacterium]
MRQPPIPDGEPERLAALRRYRILDTLPEQVYDDLTRLAAHICQTPIALVSLIDAQRQWFKSRVGLEVPQTDRAYSFCAHAVASRETLIVPNALEDGRFAGNPLVTGDPEIRFYAGTPLLSSDGHALGTLCVIDRKPRRFRDDHRDMLAALGRLVMIQIELRLHLAERESIERAKSEFVSIVSHELRTPLTSIRGSLGLIEGGVAGEIPPKVAQMVGIARANADRLIRLINDMLDLAKIEAGGVELKLAALAPGELLEAVQAEIRAVADAAGVELAFQADTGESRVLGDCDRIVQVLLNLLANAVKVTPRGGTVAVAATAGGPGSIRFAVRDQGPGIPDTELRHIFDKFRQVDPSGRDRTGTGLGLPICKAILDQHGSSIGVESEPGKGSLFWFELTAAPAYPSG